MSYLCEMCSSIVSPAANAYKSDLVSFKPYQFGRSNQIAMEERRQATLDTLFTRGQELCSRSRVPIRDPSKADIHRELDRRSQSAWTIISWLGSLERERSFWEEAQRLIEELDQINAELTKLGL